MYKQTGLSHDECAVASGVAYSCVVLMDTQKSASHIFFYNLMNTADVLRIILFELYAG